MLGSRLRSCPSLPPVQWRKVFSGLVLRLFAAAESRLKSEKSVTTPVRPAPSSIKKASAAMTAAASWKLRHGLAGTLITFVLNRSGVAKMASPVPPSMDDCDPKERCRSGPNAGAVYSSLKPCYPGGEFDKATCECSYPLGWESINAAWSILVTSLGRSFYTTPAWHNGYQGYNTQNPSSARVNGIQLNFAGFASSRYCTNVPSVGNDQNGVFHISFDILPREGSEDSVRTRGGCYWPRGCGRATYNNDNGSPSRCISYTVSGFVTGRRREFDSETGRSILRTYLLFDNFDRNDPNADRTSQLNEYPRAGGPITSFFNGGCTCLS